MGSRKEKFNDRRVDMEDALEYCRAEVARAFPDLYLVSLCGRVRDYKALWAVLALQSELINIGNRAPDPTLRLIRLAWWRETITVLYQNPGSLPPHPVARALTEQGILNLGGPAQHLIFRMLDAQEKYVEFLGDKSAQKIGGPAEDIFSLLFDLMAVIIQGRMEEGTDLLALARAYAWVLWTSREVETPPRDLTDIIDRHWAATMPQQKEKVFRALRALIRIYLGRERKRMTSAHFPKYKASPPFLALRVWTGTIFET